MEQDGERRIGILLQAVDEFVKIAPEIITEPKAVPAVSCPPQNKTFFMVFAILQFIFTGK